MKNAIILTHGWTGSSVFSALLGEAGYWLGGETVRKPDYNTFENADLVTINQQLLLTLAPDLDHEHSFNPADVDTIFSRAAGVDLQRCRDMAALSAQHTPWLWKDPRLTWTIRVWAGMLDLNNTAFLVLTRDPIQAWISANSRRHVQSMQFTRRYNDGITQSNLRFLEEHSLPFAQTSFEDLLLAPEATLSKLNDFFGTSLTLGDLRSVCHEPLHRKSRDWKDFALALMIYMKNYGQRDGRGRQLSSRLARSGTPQWP